MEQRDLDLAVTSVDEFIMNECQYLPDQEAEIIATMLKQQVADGHILVNTLMAGDLDAVIRITLFCYAFGRFRERQDAALSQL